MKTLNENNIVISIYETVSELAGLELMKEFYTYNKSKTEKEIDNLIWIENEEGALIFTKEAQNLFNIYYDKYWSVLEKLAIK